MPTDAPTWEETTEVEPTWDETTPAIALTVLPTINPNVGRLISPEQRTTFGGLRKPVASFAETMVEPVEALTTPRITAPKLEVKTGEALPLSVGKEALNIAASIPEFLSSDVGILSMIGGAAAPVATAAAFTTDMMGQLGNQILSTYRNWGGMTPNQKAAAITDIVGTAGMAGLMAHGTARGIRKGIPTVTQTTPVVTQEQMPTTPTETGLRPAVRKVGGEVEVGDAGQTHPEIIKENEIKAPEIDQRGFVNQQGQFLDREQAAAATPEIPTSTEPERRHSTDLPEAKAPEAEAAPKTESDYVREVYGIGKDEKFVAAAVLGKSGKVYTDRLHAQAFEKAKVANDAPEWDEELSIGYETDKGHFVPNVGADRIQLGLSHGKAWDAAKGTEVAPARDWDLFYENLTGELDAYNPARESGKINYDLEDMASRFVDYAKADKEGRTLDQLVSDFAEEDTASKSQISKLSQSVKRLMEGEKKVAPAPPVEAKPEVALSPPAAPTEAPPAVAPKPAEAGKGEGKAVDVSGHPERLIAVNYRKPGDLAIRGAKRVGEKRFGGVKYWSIPESELANARALGATVNRELTSSLIQPTDPTPAPPAAAEKGTASLVSEPPTTELQAGVPIPGLERFTKEDVIPAMEEAAKTVRETGQQVKSLLAPPTMGPEAGAAAGIIREHRARLAQQDLQAREKFAKAKAQMDRLESADALAFIDRIERGAPQPTPKMDALARDLRAGYVPRIRAVRAVNPNGLQHLIQDYFPHIWKDPSAAVSWYARILGRRPLKGPASFLKRRTIPTTAQGVAAGLEPVTYNPVELTLLKYHEMDRYVMGQKIFQEFKDKGLAQFSRSDIPPDGYAKINDRVANVVQYRPTTTASGAPGAPERILRGHWYVQEDAARVLNNFLSPGLERFKWFRALRWLGNNLNMAQLGLSGYHFTFTMIDSATSKLSLGIEQASQGKPKGATTIARGVAGVPLANQLEYYYKGSKVLQEYSRPGSVGGDYAKIVDGLIAGGGRTEMPKIFKNSSLENFVTALRSGNYPGAVVRAPFAAIEAVSYPLMQNIVPRLKLGAFSDMALSEFDRLGPTATREQIRTSMGKIWDSVDNRMGELVYDNLFWNRTLKDMSFLAVRAVGWNLGTIRELGGGAVDSIKVISRIRSGEPVVTKRMAYVVALPITVGIMGAIYQKLRTGNNPESIRDYYYPLTGKTLPDGTPERVNFPSYLKDIGSYSRHPLTTIGHKLHPMWSTVIDMLNNRDFYGTQIHNPDDPLVKQVQQEAEFIAKTFIPFSVKGAQRRVGAAESPATKAESFFGVMPISPEIARTPAQNKIMEYSIRRMPQGARTPEEMSRFELRKETEALLQSPADIAAARAKLLQAQREGKLTKGQRQYQQGKLRFETQQMNQGRSKSQAQWLWRYKHLNVDEAQHVYDLSTPAEQKVFEPELRRKQRKAGIKPAEPTWDNTKPIDFQPE